MKSFFDHYDDARWSERLSAMDDPSAAQQSVSAIRQAFEVASFARAIDFGGLEARIDELDPREAYRELERPLATMWELVDELLHLLSPLGERHAGQSSGEDGAAGEDEGDLEFDFDFAQTETAVAETNAPKLSTPLQRVDETAWAMSFVIRGELERFRERLPTLLKASDSWELLSSAQDHAGQLRAATNALIKGVFTSLPAARDDPEEIVDLMELKSSLELRARLFELRDRILECEARLESAPRDDWESLVKSMHREVESFVFGPAFAWMRARDKRSFLHHRNALKEITQFWSPLRAAPAKTIVQALARHLEALEVINQRECLQYFDREKIREVVSLLEDREHAPDASTVGKALLMLDEVKHRDHELSALIEAGLDPMADFDADAVIARAKFVLFSLDR